MYLVQCNLTLTNQHFEMKQYNNMIVIYVDCRFILIFYYTKNKFVIDPFAILCFHYNFDKVLNNLCLHNIFFLFLLVKIYWRSLTLDKILSCIHACCLNNIWKYVGVKMNRHVNVSLHLCFSDTRCNSQMQNRRKLSRAFNGLRRLIMTWNIAFVR